MLSSLILSPSSSTLRVVWFCRRRRRVTRRGGVVVVRCHRRRASSSVSEINPPAGARVVAPRGCGVCRACAARVRFAQDFTGSDEFLGATVVHLARLRASSKSTGKRHVDQVFELGDRHGHVDHHLPLHQKHGKVHLRCELLRNTTADDGGADGDAAAAAAAAAAPPVPSPRTPSGTSLEPADLAMTTEDNHLRVRLLYASKLPPMDEATGCFFDGGDPSGAGGGGGGGGGSSFNLSLPRPSRLLGAKAPAAKAPSSSGNNSPSSSSSESRQRPSLDRNAGIDCASVAAAGGTSDPYVVLKVRGRRAGSAPVAADRIASSATALEGGSDGQTANPRRGSLSNDPRLEGRA